MQFYLSITSIQVTFPKILVGQEDTQIHTLVGQTNWADGKLVGWWHIQKDHARQQKGQSRDFWPMPADLGERKLVVKEK